MLVQVGAHEPLETTAISLAQRWHGNCVLSAVCGMCVHTHCPKFCVSNLGCLLLWLAPSGFREGCTDYQRSLQTHIHVHKCRCLVDTSAARKRPALLLRIDGRQPVQDSTCLAVMHSHQHCDFSCMLICKMTAQCYTCGSMCIAIPNAAVHHVLAQRCTTSLQGMSLGGGTRS